MNSERFVTRFSNCLDGPAKDVIRSLKYGMNDISFIVVDVNFFFFFCIPNDKM